MPSGEKADEPCLVSGSGSEEVHFHLVKRNLWRVGRENRNDIVLKDESISRRHAMIQRTGNQFLLIDLGSRNGAFVNGSRVSVPAYLKDQDEITLGKQLFIFSQPRGTGETVEAPDESSVSDSTHLLFALQQITVLVVDIRDFTGLSQQIDETALAQTIGSWIRRAGPILQKEGSWAQKYIGDAIMGIWVHEKGRSDAETICKALRALSKLTDVTGRLQAEFQLPSPVEIGAGLNTDMASLGNLGSGDSADYTALGDGVNKAFRLESHAKKMKRDLLLGEETFAFIESAAGTLFEKHAVQLKGYKEPLHAYATMYENLPKALELLVKALKRKPRRSG